ncbi:hypothetical protein NDU88_010218 [Pleurodeles waltl]|uniref:Secreted protein n=1 Tax=Pleurodeles waltl TaxID=8319 RepID=A0AAV7PX95_PLEWA|nr:hypothetical protein NDU88_010218 [Pleurodeles waltl]
MSSLISLSLLVFFIGPLLDWRRLDVDSRCTEKQRSGMEGPLLDWRRLDVDSRCTEKQRSGMEEAPASQSWLLLPRAPRLPIFGSVLLRPLPRKTPPTPSRVRRRRFLCLGPGNPSPRRPVPPPRYHGDGKLQPPTRANSASRRSL